jgi:hypothetical protein
MRARHVIALLPAALLIGCTESHPKLICDTVSADDFVPIMMVRVDADGAACPETLSFDEFYPAESLIPHRCEPIEDNQCDAEMICSLPDLQGVLHRTHIVLSMVAGGVGTAEIDMGAACTGEYAVTIGG